MLLVIGVLIGELLYNNYTCRSGFSSNHNKTVARGGLLQNQKLTFQTLLHLLSVRHWVFLIIIFNKVLMN